MRLRLDLRIEPTEESKARAEDALKRALASDALGHRSRLPRLLTYLVREELAGRGEALKAYSIATAALDRGDDFDPNTDSIVRVEVNRLRQALDHFYATTGSTDPVRIQIPKGGYRPVFQENGRRGATDALSPLRNVKGVVLGGALLVSLLVIVTLWGLSDDVDGDQTAFSGVRVLVEPFEPVEGDKAAPALAFGLSSRLVSTLSQYPWLSVVQSPRNIASVAEAMGSEELSVRADFVLTGELAVLGDSLQVAVSLLTVPSLETVWTNRYEEPFDPSNISRTQLTVASEIGETIGAQHGIVPGLTLSQSEVPEGASFESFRCLLDIYDYWDRPSEQAHLSLRRCLETAVTTTPAFGEAWAALAFVYMDESRQNRNPRPETDPWADASNAVAQAIEHAPISSLSLNAALTYEISRPQPDFDAFYRYGMRKLQIRPNDPFTLPDFGGKLGINAGRWKEGMTLHAKAMSLVSDPPAWFRFAPAYHAVLGKNDETAYRLTRVVASEKSTSGSILGAIGAHRAGKIEELRLHIASLGRLGLQTPDLVEAYIANRRYEPKLTAALTAQIRDAFAGASR